MRKAEIISIWGNDDPRIDRICADIHAVIDKRARGVFQLATVLGILDTIKYELYLEVREGK